MSKFEAIIFDCDGVLIDSEWIKCRVNAEHITKAGYAITKEEYIERFFGENKHTILSNISQELGYNIAPRIDIQSLRVSYKEAFRDNLSRIEGVEYILNHRNRPNKIGVGSSSDAESLIHNINTARLMHFFGQHIYSTDAVQNDKPAPDIYLHVADQLNVDPQGCLVIEDSPVGVQAAINAGMTVWGFVGGNHIINKDEFAQRLSDLGAIKVFQTMKQLALEL